MFLGKASPTYHNWIQLDSEIASPFGDFIYSWIDQQQYVAKVCQSRPGLLMLVPPVLTARRGHIVQRLADEVSLSFASMVCHSGPFARSRHVSYPSGAPGNEHGIAA